ncbi:MAG TPA: helix-turn-helix domain-containing protein [Polyangiaceae bacterium]
MKPSADKIPARAEIPVDSIVVRGALKVISGDVVIDVARAPWLVVAGPWKCVALRSCVVSSAAELSEADRAAASARAAESLAERILARAAPTVEARIERLLADLARRHGTRVSGGMFLALPLRGRDVASLVGTTNESVSRVLAAWKRSGRIRAARDGVWISA